MPKDVVLPAIAEWYRERGFTALVFDTFGIGSSDGEPRCDVSDPAALVSVGWTKIYMKIHGPTRAPFRSS